MKRYVIKARRHRAQSAIDWEFDTAEQTATTLYAVEEKDTFTGVYDANGDEIHYMPQPIGFDLGGDYE